MTTSDPSEPDDRPAVPPGTIDLPLNTNAPSAFSSGVGHAQPQVSAEPPGEPEPEGPVRLVGYRRQRVVAVGITATTILSLLAISLLYYRWAKKPEPEATIVVWAGTDEAWDGATVTVRGGSLGTPLTYVLSKDENLIVRFHVPPGDYLVRVQGKDGRLLGERQSRPNRPLMPGSYWWPFHAPPAATQSGMQ